MCIGMSDPAIDSVDVDLKVVNRRTLVLVMQTREMKESK